MQIYRTACMALGLAFVATLVACDGGKPARMTDGQEAERRTKALDTEAKQMLAEVMFDPTAILVRKLVRGSGTDGRKAICGEVNGKNRMGGYVGFRPFIALKGAATAVFMDSASGESSPTLEERGEQVLYNRAFAEYCAQPVPVNGKAAAPIAQTSPVVVPKLSSAPQVSVIKNITSIPKEFRGEWRLDTDKCGSQMDDPVQYIGSDGIDLYEGGSKLKSIKYLDPYSVKVRLQTNSGEDDETWEGAERWVLSKSRNDLTTIGKEMTSTWHRCLAKASSSE